MKVKYCLAGMALVAMPAQVSAWWFLQDIVKAIVNVFVPPPAPAPAPAPTPAPTPKPTKSKTILMRKDIMPTWDALAPAGAYKIKLNRVADYWSDLLASDLKTYQGVSTVKAEQDAAKTKISAYYAEANACLKQQSLTTPNPPETLKVLLESVRACVSKAAVPTFVVEDTNTITPALSGYVPSKFPDPDDFVPPTKTIVMRTDIMPAWTELVPPGAVKIKLSRVEDYWNNLLASDFKTYQNIYSNAAEKEEALGKIAKYYMGAKACLYEQPLTTPISLEDVQAYLDVVRSCVSKTDPPIFVVGESVDVTPAASSYNPAEHLDVDDYPQTESPTEPPVPEPKSIDQLNEELQWMLDNMPGRNGAGIPPMEPLPVPEPVPIDEPTEPFDDYQWMLDNMPGRNGAGIPPMETPPVPELIQIDEPSEPDDYQWMLDNMPGRNGAGIPPMETPPVPELIQLDDLSVTDDYQWMLDNMPGRNGAGIPPLEVPSKIPEEDLPSWAHHVELHPKLAAVPDFRTLDTDDDGLLTRGEWVGFITKLDSRAREAAKKAHDKKGLELLQKIIDHHYKRLESCVAEIAAKSEESALDAAQFKALASTVNAHCDVKFRYSLLAGPPPFEWIAGRKTVVTADLISNWFESQAAAANKGPTPVPPAISELVGCIQHRFAASHELVDRSKFYNTLSSCSNQG